MDLESHRCIVNKQNVTLFLCVRDYGCHATHVLHSSNNHFQKQFCLTIKLAVNSILLLLFHDAVSAAREQHAQQPLTLVVVSVRVFRSVAMRLYAGKSSFVYFSAINLTL